MTPTPNTTSHSQYPLAWIASYLAAGVLLARTLSDWHIVAAAVVVVLIVLAVFKRQAARAMIPMLFVPLGMVCYQAELNGISDDRIRKIYESGRVESGEPVEIEGMLVASPEPTFDGAVLTLQVDVLIFEGRTNNVTGRVRLFLVSPDVPDLGYGSRVRVLCRLEREEKYRNPGGASRIEIMDQQGIDATAIIKSAVLIERLGDENVFLPLRWVYEIRSGLLIRFRRYLQPQTAGVMTASLLGSKYLLDKNTGELFREGGTFHVLVISGLHITFIGGISVWFVSLFTRRKIAVFGVTAGFLWAYTLAVGADVPVVRATLMFTALLLGHVVHRSGSLLNSLGGCLFLLLVWRPSDLFSPSFQLTAVSVASIVVSAFPLIEKLREIGRWMPSREAPFPPRASRRLKRFCELLYWNEMSWRIDNGRQVWSANLFKSPFLPSLAKPNLQTFLAYLFEAFTVSLIVQLWMLPLAVIYFHRVSVVSLILNIWVGFFLALESFAAIAGVGAASVSEWLAAPFFVLTEVFQALLTSVPLLFSNWDWTNLRVPVYSGVGGWTYAGYGIAVLALGRAHLKWDPFSLTPEKRSAHAIAACVGVIVFGALIIFHPFSAPRPDGMLTVDFLDVGQGDSALITFPNGDTMLVDGGGRPDYSDTGESDLRPDLPGIGEAVVSEFLWEKGYSSVDHIVATHADADHIQGLVDVAKNFGVGRILIGRERAGNLEFEALMRVAETNEIPIAIVTRGHTFEIGGARVSILHPDREQPPAGESPNDASIVFRIDFGERSFLLTGDIERRGESELLSVNRELRADVVKVPHHGSRTSSTVEFVENTRPFLAIVPVGKRSRFGHPHREVLERWQNAGAEILKTGDSGTITVKTNGADLWLGTFIPK